jgi:hypothetical protein
VTHSPLLLDTLDDRRELWGLLHRLEPLARVRYLRRVCRAADPARTGQVPEPVPEMVAVMVPEARRCDRGDERLTNACYADVIAVCFQYDVSLPAVAAELERYVRTGSLPPAAGRPTPGAAGGPGGPPASAPRAPSPASARTPCSTGSARPPSPPTG